MSIKRVIAAATLIVVPPTASSAALAVPAALQNTSAAATAVLTWVTSKGTQYVDTVLNKVSELRNSLDFQSVTRYQELDAIAQSWSEQQAVADDMSHRLDFTSAYPLDWTTGSENVAWRTAGGGTGAQIFNQWLNSPNHYKDITNSNVNSISIGFAQTLGDKWYATQNFAAYNVSNSTLTPSTTTAANTTTTTTKSNIPLKTADISLTDTTVPSLTPTLETAPSTSSTETIAPAPTTPPASETTTPASAPSAPTTTMTTQIVTTTGTPAKPSATPVVVAPYTTPMKPILATTGPSVAVAVTAASLLGAGTVLVMRRRQAS